MPKKRNGIPWRKNVLVLVIAGYVVVILIFLSPVIEKGGMTASETCNVIERPLMALIGGSLALSKNLVDDPETDEIPDPHKKTPKTIQTQKG